LQELRLASIGSTDLAILAVFNNRLTLMLYRLGRLLQLAGLIILPVAIAGDLAEKLDLKQSLALSAIGIVMFFAGWLMQQGRKP
jgi:hypothetical protein